MVRNVFDGRVHFHNGDQDIAPGLSLHHIGGHTAGMMSVRVNTDRGNVVLASDASHFYANMEDRRPFVIVQNHADMMQGHRKLYQLADSENHVIPGHDPLVMARYQAPSEALNGIVVRLDQAPLMG
jgi:glyoxylase-like metal-dependent hydrolase (beta-lactamase superfamily II)